MAARVIQGDVFDVLPTLEPGSIDCAVTSPPYWMLRSYLPKDHPLKPRELGSEPTPAAYVANVVKVMRLVRDALADHGTAWINCGDTYSCKPAGCKGVSRSSTLNGAAGDTVYRKTLENSVGQKQDTTHAVCEGSLCLIPQRLAVALSDDGWPVRSVVVWHKPACMPASLSGWLWKKCRVKVKATGKIDGRKNAGCVNHAKVRLSRFTGGVENPLLAAQWRPCPGCRKCEPNGGYVLRRGSWRPTSSYEPVLMLAKRRGYYADGIAVGTPAASATVSRNAYTRVLDDPGEQFAVKHDHETTGGTANLRDVWSIAAEPLREQHYASFPTRLVSLCLRAGTSARGYCPRCGAPWCRVVESTEVQYRPNSASNRGHSDYDRNGTPDRPQRGAIGAETKTIDWRPTCPCPEAADPRPGRVLDPFCGSARTGLEALRLGLDFTGVELNPDYVSLATRLLRAESPLFAGLEG